MIYSRSFWAYNKKHETLNDTPPIQMRIYVKRTANKITFKNQIRFIDLLTTETMELLESTEEKIR